MATDKQIQLIHVLKNKAGFDDETYLQMLEEFGVQSSKNLTSAQAAKLIDFYAGDPFCVISVCGKYFKERLAGKIANIQKKMKV